MSDVPTSSSSAPPAEATPTPATVVTKETDEQKKITELMKEKTELAAKVTAMKEAAEKERTSLEKILSNSEEAAKKREDMLRMIAVTQRQRAEAIDNELEQFTEEVAVISGQEETVTTDLEEKEYQLSLARAKTALEEKTVLMETVQQRAEHFEAKSELAEKSSKALHSNTKALKSALEDTRKTLQANDDIQTNENKITSDKHALVEEEIKDLETDANEQLTNIEESIKSKTTLINKISALAKEAFELQTKLTSEQSNLLKEEQSYITQRKNLWIKQQQLLLLTRTLPEEVVLKEKMMILDTQKSVLLSEIEHRAMRLRALEADASARKEAQDAASINAILGLHEDIVGHAENTVEIRTSMRTKKIALQKLRRETDGQLADLESEIAKKSLQVEGIRAKRLLEAEDGNIKRQKSK